MHHLCYVFQIYGIYHAGAWQRKIFCQKHTHTHTLTLTSNTNPWDHHVHTLLHMMPMICLIFGYKKKNCVSVTMETEPIHESHWSEERRKRWVQICSWIQHLVIYATFYSSFTIPIPLWYIDAIHSLSMGHSFNLGSFQFYWEKPDK